jgi:hypothetical protein
MPSNPDDIKKIVANLQLPQPSGQLKATLNAIKGLPNLQSMQYAKALQAIKPSPQWLEFTTRLNETFRAAVSWTDAHKTEIGSLVRSIQAMSSQIGGVMGEFHKHWQQTLAPMFEGMRQAYQARLEIYPDLSSRLDMLAKRGWFISMFFGLSEFDQIATAADRIDDDTLEGIIAKAYRDSLEDHVASILHEYPEREFAIRPALNAHLRGEYALSVPIFFAQADGICAAMVGRHIFSGKKGRSDHISSLAAEKISDLEGQNEEEGIELFRLLHLALWQPLSDHQPISFSASKRETEDYVGLNRHTVLHGESLDYATELNSLKAFSFLSYVASLLAKRGT